MMGFAFCENNEDDCDMLKQLQSLYAKSNNATQPFNHCTMCIVHVYIMYARHLVMKRIFSLEYDNIFAVTEPPARLQM